MEVSFDPCDACGEIADHRVRLADGTTLCRDCHRDRHG